MCLIFTWPGPGVPTSTSSSCIFSGPPFSCIRIDFDIVAAPRDCDFRRNARRSTASSIVSGLLAPDRRRCRSMSAQFILAATPALAAPAIVRAQEILKSAKAAYRLVTLSRDLEQPWSMAFLPDGRMLITERPGRLRVFANGRLERTPLAGVPKVYARGQAGLLDVCLHPAFAQNRVLYLSYVAGGRGGAATTVARAELGDGGLRNVHADLRGPAAPAGQPQSRLAHRLRSRRPDVRDLRRPLPDEAGAGSRRSRRQDRAPAGTTARCRRTIPSSAEPACGRRSSPGATAIRRASRCIPRPARSGRSSTGPRAATSSTS